MSSQSGSPSGSRVQVGTIAALVLLSLFATTGGAELEVQQVFSGEACAFDPTSPCPTCSYRWAASEGSPPLSDSIVFNWTAPSVTSSRTVSILLTVMSEDGCFGQEEMEIVVSPGQMVNGPDEICDGETARFSANAEFDSYDWQAFDAGRAGIGEFNDTGDASVSWTPPGPGEYIVALNGGGLDVEEGYQKQVTVHETPVCAIEQAQ